MRDLVRLGPSAASCTQSRFSSTPGPGPNTALSLSSSASTCSHLELTCSHSVACNWMQKRARVRGNTWDRDAHYYKSDFGFSITFISVYLWKHFCQTCKWFVLIFSNMMWPLCRCDSMQDRNSYKEKRVTWWVQMKRAGGTIALPLAHIVHTQHTRTHIMFTKIVYS